MEPGGSMPHSQGLSNNSYPEPNQPNYPHWYISSRYILILSSHLRLGLPKGLFPVGLAVTILKALLPIQYHRRISINNTYGFTSYALWKYLGFNPGIFGTETSSLVKMLLTVSYYNQHVVHLYIVSCNVSITYWTTYLIYCISFKVNFSLL